MPALVTVGAKAGVATVTLARAAMHNALVPEMLLELCVALERIARRDDLRCVVLRADGPAFSIGGDMRQFLREMNGARLHDYAAELVGLLNQAMLAMMRLPQPVVASLHGLVTGGSIGLVLASDVVFAAETVRFKAHYSSSGFSPDGGWSVLLPRIVGVRRAAWSLLLNGTIDATRARDWGFVNQVCAPGELRATVDAAANRIASSPIQTTRAAKQLLWGEIAAIETALERERQCFVETIMGSQARTGVEHFLSQFTAYPDEEGNACT